MSTFFPDKKSSLEKAARIITEAEKEAETIITAASKKAEQIIRESHLFTRRVYETLKKNLTETTEEISSSSQADLAKLLEQHQLSLTNFLKNLEEKTSVQARVFQTQAQERLLKIEESLGQELKTEYKNLLQEAKKSQDKKLADFAAMLDKKMPDIVKEVVGRAIPLEKHEEIVRGYLEDIKNTRPWTKT